MTEHSKGLCIAFFGILTLSPDSLLIRMLGMPNWDVLFWRGLLTFVGMFLLSYYFYRAKVYQKYRDLGFVGLGIAVCFCISTMGFVSAILFTDVANALIIVATSSVFAALFSRIFLHESVSWFTWLAILIVLAAITLLVGDSWKQGTWLGDLCALTSAICMALTFVLTRKYRHIDMLPAMSLSGLLTSLVCVLLVSDFTMSAQQSGIMVLLGLIIVIAYAAFVISPRYISAPEVSMMLPLESVFGTLLVWVVLAEQPSKLALICGGVIIVTLFTHAIFKRREISRIAQPIAS